MPRTYSTGITIKIIQNSAVSPDLDSLIRAGLVECYPKDSDHFSHQRAWHSEPSWIVCAFSPDGTVAAHVAIVEREVLVGGTKIPVRVAGPQGVFVRPPWRKMGLSNIIMETAREESCRQGLEAGLLFCRPELETKVYGRMGWKKVNSAVFMSDDSGRTVPIDSKSIAMAIPIAIEQFPAGDIDLQGPDW
ncbi:GNAT family N-acetyltransferase [bacterium]|nr:GNAT family N-acetyltransferase [bacterium]